MVLQSNKGAQSVALRQMIRREFAGVGELQNVCGGDQNFLHTHNFKHIYEDDNESGTASFLGPVLHRFVQSSLVDVEVLVFRQTKNKDKDRERERAESSSLLSDLVARVNPLGGQM